MSAGFDIAATTYDKDFTHSRIGTLQRDRVWQLLDSTMNTVIPLDVLELNCGTGEDAIRLANQGHHVTASDISEGMLEIAKNKKDSSLVNFQRIDLNNIEHFTFEAKFDIVFSNFGGLNCIDAKAMSHLGHTISQILRPGGKFISVIMPDLCLWETSYYLLKGKIKDAFRRQKEYAMANLSGSSVKTWYYSPKEHRQLIESDFEVVKLKPIGLFIPPSYLENFFSRRLKLLHYLNSWERYFARFSWQARLADHYYIEYILK